MSHEITSIAQTIDGVSSIADMVKKFKRELLTTSLIMIDIAHNVRNNVDIDGDEMANDINDAVGVIKGVMTLSGITEEELGFELMRIGLEISGVDEFVADDDIRGQINQIITERDTENA